MENMIYVIYGKYDICDIWKIPPKDFTKLTLRKKESFDFKDNTSKPVNMNMLFLHTSYFIKILRFFLF